MTKLVKTTRKLATPRKSRQAAKAGQFIISMMNQEPEPAPEPVEPEVPEVAPEPVEPEVPEVAPEAKPARKSRKDEPMKKVRRTSREVADAKPAKPARARKAAPVITKPEAAREASKKAMLIEMLRRGEGVSTAEIMNTFGWQAHTCRGLISTLKKGGLPITAEHTRNVGPNQTGAKGSTTRYRLPA
jgi:hypothetical protein